MTRCPLCLESTASQLKPVTLEIAGRNVSRLACHACRKAPLIRPHTLWQIKRWAARSGIHESRAKPRHASPFNVNPLAGYE